MFAFLHSPLRINWRWRHHLRHDMSVLERTYILWPRNVNSMESRNDEIAERCKRVWHISAKIVCWEAFRYIIIRDEALWHAKHDKQFNIFLMTGLEIHLRVLQSRLPFYLSTIHIRRPDSKTNLELKNIVIVDVLCHHARGESFHCDRMEIRYSSLWIHKKAIL